MPLSPHAGKPAPKSLLVDLAQLERAYYDGQPDTANPAQLVSFGTSGHRGTSLNATFTQAHILAITQAICDYRAAQGISGPLFMGKDSHALSAPAQRTALEVLAANNVDTIIAPNDGITPTPVISRAILTHNRARNAGLADGIVITPSHNPPEDGGFKYNPTNGGPADTDITRLGPGPRQRTPPRQTTPPSNASPTPPPSPPLPRINKTTSNPTSRISSTSSTWTPSARPGSTSPSIHSAAPPSPTGSPSPTSTSLNLTIVNQNLDPAFSFMTVDHDGKIRMDCSSPYAMASLLALKDKFALAFACDPDADRHGIVTPSVGLLNPNAYLAVAIQYLLTHRPEWPASAIIGKTLVSSSMIDRVVAKLGRSSPKSPSASNGSPPASSTAPSASAAKKAPAPVFLRQNATVWTTDKDGLILGLLAAEITAVTGKDPGQHYAALTPDSAPPTTPASTPPPPPTRNPAFQTQPRCRQAVAAGRRTHPRQAHPRPRQQRPHRRPESHHPKRLVRRPPLRHREHLQNLRRVLPQPRPPLPPRRGSPIPRHRRPRVTRTSCPLPLRSD